MLADIYFMGEALISDHYPDLYMILEHLTMIYIIFIKNIDYDDDNDHHFINHLYFCHN